MTGLRVGWMVMAATLAWSWGCGGAGAGRVSFIDSHHDVPVSVPSARAFREGGVPIHDPTIVALIDQLPNVVSTGERVQLPVLTGTVFADVVPAFFDAATKLVVGPTILTLCRRECGDLDDLTHEVVTRAGEVNAALASAGLGYYFVVKIESDAAGRQVELYPFSVDQVTIVETAGVSHSVLGLRPWSRLYLENALGKANQDSLGITFGDTPTMLLDNIEQNSGTRLARVLADEPVTPDSPFEDVLLAPTLAAIRADLVRALSNDAEPAARIARLLVERDRLKASWPRSELGERRRAGQSTTAPGMSGTAAAERMVEIEHALARSSAPRIVARITALVRHEVALHEAQHATDRGRTTPLAQPAGLAVALPGDRGNVVTTAEVTTSELSAYLGELAHEHVVPHDVLWDAAWPAIDHDDAPIGNAYAGAIMVRELARYFGETEDPLTEAGTIDVTRVAKLTNRLAARTGNELNAAAEAVWQRLFGEPLADARTRGDVSR